jgi:hypothetical protein
MDSSPVYSRQSFEPHSPFGGCTDLFHLNPAVNWRAIPKDQQPVPATCSKMLEELIGVQTIERLLPHGVETVP